MAVLLSSNRSKNKTRSNLRSYGTRHGDQFWDEESKKGNFGLKYMEKCGWSRGDGLGAERQGTKQYIRSSKKRDGLGLGADEHTNDTMYKATVCMFNDILSRLGKKKTSDNASKPIANDVSASATIRQYEAKTVLWGNFKAGSDKTGASTGRSASIGGFTEADQTAYATHITSLADSRSGKQGLGFGHKTDTNHRSNPFTFGRFVSSGHIDRSDIFNESENAEHLKEANIIDPSVVTDGGKEKSKKKKKDKSKKSKKDKKSKKSKSKPEIIAENAMPNPLSTDNSNAAETTVISEKKRRKEKKEKKSKKQKRSRKELESDEIDITDNSQSTIDDSVCIPALKKQKMNDNSTTDNSEVSKKKKKKNKDKSKRKKSKQLD